MAENVEIQKKKLGSMTSTLRTSIYVKNFWRELRFYLAQKSKKNSAHSCHYLPSWLPFFMPINFRPVDKSAFFIANASLKKPAYDSKMFCFLSGHVNA